MCNYNIPTHAPHVLHDAQDLGLSPTTSVRPTASDLPSNHLKGPSPAKPLVVRGHEYHRASTPLDCTVAHALHFLGKLSVHRHSTLPQKSPERTQQRTTCSCMLRSTLSAAETGSCLTAPATFSNACRAATLSGRNNTSAGGIHRPVPGMRRELIFNTAYAFPRLCAFASAPLCPRHSQTGHFPLSGVKYHLSAFSEESSSVIDTSCLTNTART